MRVRLFPFSFSFFYYFIFRICFVFASLYYSRSSIVTLLSVCQMLCTVCVSVFLYLMLGVLLCFFFLLVFSVCVFGVAVEIVFNRIVTRRHIPCWCFCSYPNVPAKQGKSLPYLFLPGRCREGLAVAAVEQHA